MEHLPGFLLVGVHRFRFYHFRFVWVPACRYLPPVLEYRQCRCLHHSACPAVLFHHFTTAVTTVTVTTGDSIHWNVLPACHADTATVSVRSTVLPRGRISTWEPFYPRSLLLPFLPASAVYRSFCHTCLPISTCLFPPPFALPFLPAFC